MIDMPLATPKPCNDCPWRRSSARGWLGPLSADAWVALAHSDVGIACHQTLPEDLDKDDRTDAEKWAVPGIRQCKGAAIFRANICKSPHNPNDAEHDTEPDRESVFGWNDQFIAHHTRT